MEVNFLNASFFWKDDFGKDESALSYFQSNEISLFL